MSWIILIASGLMESVWAIALDKSDGFTNLAPTIVFFIGLILSMVGLGFAVKELPIGVAYAVWTGIGAATTAIFSIATGAEPASIAKIALLAGLIACIVGLKIVSEA